MRWLRTKRGYSLQAAGKANSVCSKTSLSSNSLNSFAFLITASEHLKADASPCSCTSRLELMSLRAPFRSATGLKRAGPIMPCKVLERQRRDVLTNPSMERFPGLKTLHTRSNLGNHGGGFERGQCHCRRMKVWQMSNVELWVGCPWWWKIVRIEAAHRG